MSAGRMSLLAHLWPFFSGRTVTPSGSCCVAARIRGFLFMPGGCGGSCALVPCTWPASGYCSAVAEPRRMGNGREAVYHRDWPPSYTASEGVGTS